MARLVILEIPDQEEAEGLVDLSEMPTLLRLRSQRVWRNVI
jgi:hypothetical protein